MTRLLEKWAIGALVLLVILIFGPDFIDPGKTLTVKVSNKAATPKAVILRLVPDNHEPQQEDLGISPPNTTKNVAFRVPAEASLFVFLGKDSKPKSVNVYLYKNINKELNIRIDDNNTIKLVSET